jgi:protein SCO1/2
MPVPNPLTRRHCLRLITGSLPAILLAGCGESKAWHTTDMSGTLPNLAFTLTRASDGKEVTAADFHGKVALLYFGYTFCPDVCPTTLLNMSQTLKRLGADADRVRVLFVTVDPDRDTLKVLREYTGAFGRQAVGLRGSKDQIAALAKRYRVAYSVEPATKDHPYEVTHSSAVYVFDGSGAIRLLFSGLATQQPDVDGKAADLRHLLGEANHQGLVSRIINYI